MASKSSIEAGRGHVTLSSDQTALERGLEAASRKFAEWGKTIAALGAGIAAAGATISAPFLTGLNAAAAWGRETTEAMRTTGLSFADLQTISRGARVEIADVGPILGRMSEFLAQAAMGGEEAVHQLRALGLTIGDLNGMSQGNRLMQIATALERIADPAQRIAAQRRILGEGGVGLNLSGGAAGIRARAARQDEVEGVRTEGDLARITAFNEASRELTQSIKGIYQALAAVSAGPMTSFVKMAVDAAIAVRRFFERNQALASIIFQVAIAAVAIGGALMGLGGLVAAASFAFGGLGIAMSAIASAAVPLGIIAAAVAALVAGLSAIGVRFGDVHDSLSFIDAAIDSIRSAFAPVITWFGSMYDAAAEFFTGLYDWLSESGFLALAADVGKVVLGVLALQAAAVGLIGYLSYLSVDALIAFDWSWIIDLTREALDQLRTTIGFARDIFRAMYGSLIDVGERALGLITNIGDTVGEAFGRTAASASDMFARLGSDAGTAWSGIQAAFRSGDWEGIWNVVVLAARLAWAELNAFLEALWIDWRHAFGAIWDSAVDALYDLFSDVWTNLRAGFWDLAAGIIEAFGSVQTFIAQLINDIFGALGPGIASRLGLTTMRVATDAAARAARNVAGGVRSDADRESAGRELERMTAAEMARIARDEAIAGIDSSEIDRLRYELSELVTMLESVPAELEGAAGRGGGAGFTTFKSTLVQGSFDARAAMQSIGANSGKTRAEVEAERHTELMRDMRDLLRDLRGVAGARWG